jgi:TRAP-type C4-dicarboxylate transport system permease small subunit
MRLIGLVVGALGLVMTPCRRPRLARRFFDTQITSAGLAVQHLTLWVGFLGAFLAAGAGKHLSLSTVEAIPPRFRRLASFVTRTAATAVCILLTVASYRVVQADSTSGRTLFLGIPVSWSEAIMPCLRAHGGALPSGPAALAAGRGAHRHRG